ncbi:unnamed protein product [Parnassius apollo]|uniref:(apollo) hypothetical protein n=1 Tax=Parnassius apollo TaxID=110799 RepID=A0A8S3WVM7_PARAO|nr:unnamed protein product [Parnassius apollo]
MSRKIFSGTNSFIGLEEAIEAVTTDSDDDREYDLAIIPPDPSVVTDEEEGSDQDIMVTYTLPRDVPGNIEVMVLDEGTLSSDYDSSDEEPLTAKRVRWQANIQQRQKTPAWRKCSPFYTFGHQHTSVVQDKQNAIKEQLKDQNSVQIFEIILDAEGLQLMLSNSILYANQNNRHSFQLDLPDLKKFIVRENRSKKCPLTATKEMKKKERAAFDYRFDKNNELLLIRWKDNSLCTMATNYDYFEPMGTVKRWCPEMTDNRCKDSAFI